MEDTKPRGLSNKRPKGLAIATTAPAIRSHDRNLDSVSSRCAGQH